MNDVIRTCDVVDELVTDDGAVVLIRAPGGHRVVRLSVLGQLIRELGAAGIPMDRLVHELESRLGPSRGEDAQRLTAESVRVMEADGLVSREPGDHAHTHHSPSDKP